MKLRLNRTTIVMIAFMAIGGYFLWAEHSAHIALAIPYLPFVLLLACPLLHLFMHGGHGHGGHGRHDQGHSNTEFRDDTGVETKLKPAPIDAPGKSRIPNAGVHHD